MSAVDRFSQDSFKRLLGAVNSVSFRDDSGEVEYFGEKVVILRKESFQLFRQELIRRNASGTGNLILGIVGRSVGRAEGRTIVSRLARETGSATLSPEYVRNAVEESNLGYGKAQLESLELTAKAATITTTNSFEAEPATRPEGNTCFFLLGYVEGLLSELLGSEMRGVETSCKSRRDPVCSFRLTRTLESKFKI